MGYTNNWRRPVELAADRFASAVADCREVLPTLGVALGGFGGDGEPVVQSDHIVFNGRSLAKCEPFEVGRVEFDRHGRGWVWSFCKTERLPYDLCVKAALIILSHHLGEQFKVGSDGSDNDWARARQLVQERKGYGATFQLTSEK